MLGLATDVTAEGILLVGESQLPADEDYYVWMEIPRQNGTLSRVFLDLRSKWSKWVGTPSRYHTGFQFVNPTSRTIGKIREFVSKF